MLVALAAVLLAAAPVKIAAPGLSYINIEAKTGDFYLEYFAQQLDAHGVQVVTAKETAVLLGMERQKELLACGASNCTAELAGMLGVDLVLVGSLAKAGGGFVVNLKLVKASDASSQAVYSTRVTSEDALLDYLKASADDLAAKLMPGAVVAPPPAVSTSPSSGSAPMLPWVASAVVAVGSVAAGATFFGLGASRASSISNGDPSITGIDQLRAARRSGEAQQAIGVSLLAVGGAAAVSAGALALLPRDSWVRKLSPGVLGLAAAIAGGVLIGMASSDASKLSSGSTDIGNYRQLEALRAGGEAKQAAGVTLISAGVVGLASSVLLILLEGHSDSAVALLPGPGAGAACLVRF